ncbi:RHS repeat domain-containing protein, partial [Bacteroides uniformis]
PTRTEMYTYSYNHADRLLKVEHTLGGTKITLADYAYDNLGRLQSKSLHGSATNKLTYAYNVRGWLTGISGTKFTQNLYYNTGNGTARYNGSISSMTWKAGNESTVRGYKFTYDGLDRLLNATYGETAGINANTDRFSENVTAYDKNGNIKTLQRYGQTAASGYGLIDNLTFTLAGNLLNRVDDAAAASAYGGGFEFKDGVKQANEYTYDSNGNLTKDLNKGISTITYNVLNLPNMVTFSDGSTIAYTYGADGTKLKTVHKTGSTTTTTDYCGNVVYENGVQKLLLTDEGYVTLSDSKYHYYLKDHQGNNRVVINQSGTVEETNHYYPFGGVFASSGNVQPYKYNGKELDAKKGLNWYDYGARHYDAALGRFTTVDPSAENYYSTSPFTYCLNNPLNYIDPLGTDTVDVKDVDWNKFDPKKDVVALDEVAVSVPNALTKVGTRALEPISGFWGYVGYYLLDIGSTYHSEQTRFTYKVGTDGVITGVAPMVGTPPLPGFAKTSNLNTIRGLWSLTKQGSSKVMKHPIRGLFYKSKSDGLWWVKDQTKHGGSFYKVYKETNKGLEWHKDADKYGNFIINKHKSDVGIFIPWKELSK